MKTKEIKDYRKTLRLLKKKFDSWKMSDGERISVILWGKYPERIIAKYPLMAEMSPLINQSVITDFGETLDNLSPGLQECFIAILCAFVGVSMMSLLTDKTIQEFSK